MAKILLVEDDNNLREIYEARLQAEGYEIVSAQNGEEALVAAKKELPDLIISDVMMPRVSGFEMLDILRNTEGLKNVKVIMLTALGQAEDRSRADSLGADRYLVKSQVTLEDIVKSAAELLPTEGATVATPAPELAAAPTPGPLVSTVAAAAPMPPPAPAIATPVAAPLTVPPVSVTPPPPVASSPPPAPEPPMPASVPVSPVIAAAQPSPTPVVPSAANADPEGAAMMAKAVKDLLASAATEPAQPSTIAPPITPPTLTAAPPPVPAAPTTAMPPATPALPPMPTPLPVPAPPVLASTPPTTPPEPAAPVTVAPAPAPPLPPNPVVSPLLATPAPTPQPPTPAPAVPPLPRPESVTLGGNRVIQPIVTNSPSQPNLNELLAREGITDMGDGHPNPAVPPPHQPGLVISPHPTDAQGQPVDPHSISL